MPAEAVNYDFLKIVIDAGALILSVIALGFGGYTWWSSRTRASKAETSEKFDGVHSRISKTEKAFQDVTGALGSRMARVEERLEHSPTHNDMEKLHSRVSEVRNALSNIAQQVASIGATVTAQASEHERIGRQLQLLIDNELAEGRAAKGERKT